MVHAKMALRSIGNNAHVIDGCACFVSVGLERRKLCVYVCLCASCVLRRHSPVIAVDSILWETVFSIRFFVGRVFLSFLRSVCEMKTCYAVFVVIPETTLWLSLDALFSSLSSDSGAIV